ncbi:hypothetical protein PUN28_003647 [Cardiocondyla obscurior]|uniref:Uncharacterized protein n=1 Tax=Cardiocondyla obscurior TaxID=286306 RepID=A0AAW2GLQ0_9HYME
MSRNSYSRNQRWPQYQITTKDKLWNTEGAVKTKSISLEGVIRKFKQITFQCNCRINGNYDTEKIISKQVFVSPFRPVKVRVGSNFRRFFSQRACVSREALAPVAALASLVWCPSRYSGCKRPLEEKCIFGTLLLMSTSSCSVLVIAAFFEIEDSSSTSDECSFGELCSELFVISGRRSETDTCVPNSVQLCSCALFGFGQRRLIEDIFFNINNNYLLLYTIKKQNSGRQIRKSHIILQNSQWLLRKKLICLAQEQQGSCGRVSRRMTGESNKRARLEAVPVQKIKPYPFDSRVGRHVSETRRQLERGDATRREEERTATRERHEATQYACEAMRQRIRLRRRVRKRERRCARDTRRHNTRARRCDNASDYDGA